MSTEAEQLRAYVLLNDWQARDVQMNGSCIFVPTKGTVRGAFVFHWQSDMIFIDHALDLIAAHENYVAGHGASSAGPRTPDNIRADLTTAHELMRSAL